MADSQGIEEIGSRLDNIRSVEPILGAMRTISLGSWQAGLNRQARVRQYSQRLAELLPALLPHLRGSKGGALRRTSRSQADDTPIEVLVIGSERGLCGAFNSSLVRYADQALAEYEREGTSFELSALGSRVKRALEREGRSLAWSRSLPMTALPSSELAYELMHNWLQRYETYELEAVDVIYNSYVNATDYRATQVRLIPPPLPPQVVESISWPPPYVDTDPVRLYTQIIRLWANTEMHRILLDSAAAEHSARYQLMEGATQNANRLIDDLTLALQAARRHAITSEMQDLAVGAGLLGT
jgi:F-type H+-transporting ATPase subunit gamma